MIALRDSLAWVALPGIVRRSLLTVLYRAKSAVAATHESRATQVWDPIAGIASAQTGRPTLLVTTAIVADHLHAKGASV